MKLRNLFWGAVASLAVFAACEEPEQNLGTPDIKLSETEVTFEAAGGDMSLTVTATRDWMVETEADWVVVSPDAGVASAQAQTVTVSVLENTGLDREASVKFTIGMKSKYLTVTQAGPGGSAEALILYHNDYDKVVAEKVYGSGTSWPYLDQFDGWMNEKGAGAADVQYAYSGMSARANSTSNSNYSDYEGSGNNNMFFGKSAYLATKNIALNGATGLSLTFGSEKYSQDLGSVFLNSEFHIFLSQDGEKWVELTDYTFAGGSTEGRWNIASADFSVPAGTESLSICMQVDAASAYRMDDLKLVISEGGAAVDFSAAVAKDFSANQTGGGNSGNDNPGGGNDNPPTGSATATIADVLASTGALASGTTIEGVVISNRALNNLTSKKGLYVQDASGALQFYLAANHEFDFGDKLLIDLSGVSVGEYNGAVQISGLALEKIAVVSTGNAVTPKSVSAADFLANKYEGQYVAVEGVQVMDSDLGRTFVEGDAHTSINMETADGGTFVIFSSKYSTFGTKAVPQGSGVIKGISSVNNGTMQIIFAQESDYAGLTGTRFDGTVPPSGGDQGGDEGGNDDVTPPSDGDYEPQLTWTLGNKAYDNTSGSNAQYGNVNGVEVGNMLKLGTSSLVGDATLHVPAGTTKLGFYCVAWKGKKADLKFSIGGTEVTTISPAANTGATGNPPYTITLADSDYYEVTMPSTAAADVKVETLDNANGRVIIIGIKPIK